MRVCHWTIYNRSGMNRVAESFVEAEKKLGIDSVLANPGDEETWVWDADINVSHTHYPDKVFRKSKAPVVWVGHGTPEHAVEVSIEDGTRGYGHSDSWMLIMRWLQIADAIVTFWPRQQTIWQTLLDNGRRAYCIPLGVDKEFWKPLPSGGRFRGKPSVFSAENQHYIKWAYDLLVLWPWVLRELPGAYLHIPYMPHDMHRWFFPLVNANGAATRLYMMAQAFDHVGLRNAFNSIDYFIGLVRYGDFNRLSLEAGACGAKTISYRGNPYADYWIAEGDQRDMARGLVPILKGKVEPREKEPIPDILDTAKAMKEIYDRLGAA